MSSIDDPLPDGYRPHIPFWTVQQREAFLRSYNQQLFALFMEPRTGKSKPTVDTACYQYERKSSPLHVNAVLVIAWPYGVHSNWIREAFPDNVPRRIKWSGMIWRTKLTDRKYYQEQFKELLAFQGLSVLAVNAEALVSNDTKKAIGQFLKARGRVMVVADESSFMATPSARRQRTMHNISKITPQVVMKRILDGTPVGKAGPLDYFTQVRFLSPSILGYSTSIEFRTHFAVMETQGDWEYRRAYEAILDSYLEAGIPLSQAETQAAQAAKGKGKSWPAIKQDVEGRPIFQNMDELWEKLEPYSYRATFEQCFNTPRKVYQKRLFVLTDEQRRIYNALRDEYQAEFADGRVITAAHHLTRVLRLQQVASNFYPAEQSIEPHGPCEGLGCIECDGLGVTETTIPLREIHPGHNPRLDALREELKYGRPTIIWARFRPDIDACFELAASMGMNPGRWDGAVSSEQQQQAKEDFQAGKSGAFVASNVFTSGATRGQNLSKAAGHVIYSNSFGMRTREQLEQRAETKSRTVGTYVVDLVAEDTVDDTLIIPALRMGMDVSAYVMRDPGKVWL